METGIKRTLVIVYRRTTDLKKHPHNARTHSTKQLKLIEKSIRKFGFLNPVLVDKYGNIIAGHGRVEAAKRLGMDQVPTICIEDLTEDEIRAYILADNKLAELAGWDREILAIELQYLCTLEDVFDIAVTGFEITEIDQIWGDVAKAADADDDLSDVEQGPIVTQLGDLWILGKHRLLCGNSLRADSYSTLMEKRRANAVFSDPPYNVHINGYAGGKGAIQHREFAMASGEMTEPKFISFLSTVLKLFCCYSVDGAVHYICMDWRHLHELLTAGGEAYDALLNLCVWAKNAPGMVPSIDHSMSWSLYIATANFSTATIFSSENLGVIAQMCGNIRVSKHNPVRVMREICLPYTPQLSPSRLLPTHCWIARPVVKSFSMLS